MERFKELTSNVINSNHNACPIASLCKDKVKPKINETKKDESSGQVVWP
ncbi:hypothetical protein L917_04887 [Phytophthora nicotianae]|uniref:Uncharacterized protein n=2 Tax=Phytophthora nicotianae TaxID=4792 RepID=W2QEQ7_PHYN3|nr:hypothetical protein PPTG_22511 [Phytophthora nicotianae INRA-310]ETL97912.1 hypothetical protein L917_04887 [Phytophthora nicotianae]ETN11652.1 hypothetical protein PPTG_22511 [Phytophthora nicotianae INRA-310]